MDLQRNIDIGIASDKARSGAARVRAALDSIKRKSKQMANAFTRDTSQMTRGFGGVKAMIVSLGGVLAARSLISSTRDFGQAVADLSAITGAVGEDLEYLRQKSKEFGETTTLSSSQAAEAFRLIASAKPDLLSNTKALATVTEEAIALAEATGSTLPQAADTLGSALNQFNSGAEESSRFINVLAAGSKYGAAQVFEIAEAMKFAGGIASNMAKISFEETNASLQLLSQFAIKGGEAGTQLRMILLALETQSNNKFKPSVVGLQQALNNLADAQLDSSDAAKLFGSRNVNAANILIQQRNRVEDLTQKLTGSTIAYEQQAIRVDTLSGDVKALKSAYEGLELTIGAELEGSLRAMTQAATENVRALSRNPLLKKGVRATLDTISTAIQDVKNAFADLSKLISNYGSNVAVFEGVWESAIDNIVRWTKYLWDQFVVGGPANLKLAATLMIAAFDRLKIGLTEKTRVIVFSMMREWDIFVANTVAAFKTVKAEVERIFILLGNAVGRTFDNIKITVADAIDALIGQVQQRIFDVARTLASLGFEEKAREISEMGIAMGNLAKAGDAAREAAEENERARQAEVDAIDSVLAAIEEQRREEVNLARTTADELIDEEIRYAEAARLASQVAVQGAIDERDATIEAIKALRQKRKEVLAAGTDPIEEINLADLPQKRGAAAIEETDRSLKELGETGQYVVDSLADGFTSLATDSKAKFSDMIESMIRDLIALALRAQIVKGLTSIFGDIGFGSGGELAVTPGGTIPKARTGLDFMVGGTGGTDSKLVAFRATPGESVSVKTPQQQKASAGGNVTVMQTNHIDARGADAARIEAMMPALMERTRQQTLADVLKLRDRGALRR